jgi:hypothetical protein
MKRSFKPLTIQIIAALIAGGILPLEGKLIDRAAVLMDDIVNGVIHLSPVPVPVDDVQTFSGNLDQSPDPAS